MLACTRIGAIHSVIFAGFSAPALKSQIIDVDCRVLITANEGVRGPKHIPLKQIMDDAIGDMSTMDTVLVVQRTETEVPMLEGRDFWLAEDLEKQRATCSIEWMDREDPLFILYTSGSTGKPKGLLHTTDGYLLYAAVTHKYIFAVQDNDIHFCAADAGWLTGQCNHNRNV